MERLYRTFQKIGFIRILSTSAIESFNHSKKQRFIISGILFLLVVFFAPFIIYFPIAVILIIASEIFFLIEYFYGQKKSSDNFCRNTKIRRSSLIGINHIIFQIAFKKEKIPLSEFKSNINIMRDWMNVYKHKKNMLERPFFLASISVIIGVTTGVVGNFVWQTIQNNPNKFVFIAISLFLTTCIPSLMFLSFIIDGKPDKDFNLSLLAQRLDNSEENSISKPLRIIRLARVFYKRSYKKISSTPNNQ